MKKFLMITLFTILTLGIVFAEVLPVERTQIEKQVNEIVDYANKGDFISLSNLISTNSKEGLKDEIEMQLAGKNIIYEEVLIGSYKEIGNNQVKVSGSYKVKGPNWSGKGALMYFIFEKSNERWQLVDTNFHKIIFPSYIFKKIGKVLLIVMPVLIIFLIFWMLMLVDCIKRDFYGAYDKLIWILVLIFTGIVGAVIYYFMVKRGSKEVKKA